MSLCVYETVMRRRADGERHILSWRHRFCHHREEHILSDRGGHSVRSGASLASADKQGSACWLAGELGRGRTQLCAHMRTHNGRVGMGKAAP